MFLGQSHERLFHYQYLFIDTTMFWGSGNSWSTGCSCPICSRGTVEEQQGAHDLPPARHPHQPWAWRMGVRVESCCLEIIQIRWEDETILEHFGKISWTSGKSWDIFQHSGNIIGNVRLETISKFTIFYCSQRQRGVSGWWWSLAQVLLPWGYIEWIDVLHLSHTQSHKWSLKADQKWNLHFNPLPNTFFPSKTTNRGRGTNHALRSLRSLTDSRSPAKMKKRG